MSTQIRWPNFFIVGVPKAGTTSLYEYLKKSQQIYMSAVKEPHYFPTAPTETQPRFSKEKYLSLIVIQLRSIDLLNTLRGSKGGYMLARPPSEISIKNIMDILEEDLNLLENIKKEEDFVSPNEKISRDLWLGLGEKIKKYLGSITLKDLIETYDKKNKKIPVNYYI